MCQISFFYCESEDYFSFQKILILKNQNLLESFLFWFLAESPSQTVDSTAELFPGQPSSLLQAHLLNQPANVFLSAEKTKTGWAVNKIITKNKKIKRVLKFKENLTLTLNRYSWIKDRQFINVTLTSNLIYNADRWKEENLLNRNRKGLAKIRINRKNETCEF